MCSLESSRYPVSFYPIRRIGLFFSAGSAIFWLASVTGHAPAGVFFGLMAVISFMHSVLYKITLTEEGIFVDRIINSRELLRREISGFEVTFTQGTKFYNLIPVDKGVKILRLPAGFFSGNDAFEGWIKSLPEIKRSLF